MLRQKPKVLNKWLPGIYFCNMYNGPISKRQNGEDSKYHNDLMFRYCIMSQKRHLWTQTNMSSSKIKNAHFCLLSCFWMRNFVFKDIGFQANLVDSKDVTFNTKNLYFWRGYCAPSNVRYFLMTFSSFLRMDGQRIRCSICSPPRGGT